MCWFECSNCGAPCNLATPAPARTGVEGFGELPLPKPMNKRQRDAAFKEWMETAAQMRAEDEAKWKGKIRPIEWEDWHDAGIEEKLDLLMEKLDEVIEAVNELRRKREEVRKAGGEE